MMRSRARFTVVAALAAGVMVLSGCKSTNNTHTASTSGKHPVAMGAVNDKCPISDKPVAADAGTATWRGHTIGFCCPKCPASWNAMSAKDKDAFVAKCTKP